MRPFPVLTVLLAAAGVACNGEELPDPERLEAVPVTNGQVGVAGARLPAALQVRVLSDDNIPVRRADVRWAVTGGTGAVLSDTLTVSDGNGIAEVGLVLGPLPGAYEVTAALAVNDAFTILTATAAPAPHLTSVTPATFAAGDTVTLAGTHLEQVDLVRIGGDVARVVTQAATQVRALAPVCRAPGPVDVQAFRVHAGSNVLAATYVAGGATTLAPGDWSVIDPALLPGCVTFPAAGSEGAEWLVTVQSTTGVQGTRAAFTFGGDSVTPAPPGPVSAADRSAAEAFHLRLRRWEADAARLPRVPMAPTLQAGPSIDRPEVGDQRDFRVCSTVTCSEPVDFASVGAEARYVGDHAALYVDLAAPAAGFSAADLDSLGALFDDDLYAVGTTWFGAESDVDQNGVVIVLLTPVVNGLTPASQCGISIITGFFFGIDIDPAFANDERSNGGEVFYAMAPDPNGEQGCELAVSLVRRLVPVTFVHEFQHMISYYQRVLLRAGEQEELWLNEGLSHLGEELAALRFDAQGQADRFSQFAIGNLFNAYLYLKETGAHPLLPAEGTGSLEERGAAWIFLRWLVDRQGDAIVRRLVETSARGADNVAAVTGEPFERLVADWFLALWASDLPGFTAPDRLTFESWRFRTTYKSLHEQVPASFDRPFPIIPAIFSGGDFAVTGTLRSGSGTHYRIVQPAGQSGFTLSLSVDDATVWPRVGVLRIR